MPILLQLLLLGVDVMLQKQLIALSEVQTEPL